MRTTTPGKDAWEWPQKTAELRDRNEDICGHYCRFLDLLFLEARPAPGCFHHWRQQFSSPFDSVTAGQICPLSAGECWLTCTLKMKKDWVGTRLRPLQAPQRAQHLGLFCRRSPTFCESSVFIHPVSELVNGKVATEASVPEWGMTQPSFKHSWWKFWRSEHNLAWSSVLFSVGHWKIGYMRASDYKSNLHNECISQYRTYKGLQCLRIIWWSSLITSWS